MPGRRNGSRLRMSWGSTTVRSFPLDIANRLGGSSGRLSGRRDRRGRIHASPVESRLHLCRRDRGGILRSIPTIRRPVGPIRGDTARQDNRFPPLASERRVFARLDSPRRPDRILSGPVDRLFSIPLFGPLTESFLVQPSATVASDHNGQAVDQKQHTFPCAEPRRCPAATLVADAKRIKRTLHENRTLNVGLKGRCG